MACGQCGGRKWRKHQRCAGQGGRDVLQFLRAGVHDVDADANPLATFEDQIAVVVQYGGLKRKRGSSRGGRSTPRGGGRAARGREGGRDGPWWGLPSPTPLPPVLQRESPPCRWARACGGWLR